MCGVPWLLRTEVVLCRCLDNSVGHWSQDSSSLLGVFTNHAFFNSYTNGWNHELRTEHVVCQPKTLHEKISPCITVFVFESILVHLALLVFAVFHVQRKHLSAGLPLWTHISRLGSNTVTLLGMSYELHELTCMAPSCLLCADDIVWHAKCVQSGFIQHSHVAVHTCTHNTHDVCGMYNSDESTTPASTNMLSHQCILFGWTGLFGSRFCSFSQSHT